MQGEYAPGAKDFSDLILKAKAANADAVFALPTPPDGMTMVKQMKELGYNPKLDLFIRAPDPPVVVARTSARTATASCWPPAGTTR